MTTLVVALLFSIHAHALNLDEFLTQVQERHEGVKASHLSSDGAQERIKESDLLFLPSLSATYDYMSAERSAQNPLYLSGGKSLSAKINEQLAWGTQIGVGYTWNYTTTTITDFSFFNFPSTYFASPTLSLDQPLWRNGFGSEIRAQRDLIQSSSNSALYSEKFKLQSYIMDAQSSYSRLYFARKTVKALEDSLHLSQKNRDWAKGRVKSNLGDEGDYLQSEAAYQLRELDLVKANLEEKNASRYFNSLRGDDSEVVKDELVAPPETKIQVKELSPEHYRNDVKAQMEAVKIAKANSILSKEKNTPSLDVFANYGSYGLSVVDSTSAVSDSWKFNPPGYDVGIKFTAPLAFWDVAAVRSGYDKDVLAQDLNLRRKTIEQNRDYQELVRKIETAAQRLKLSKILEVTQKNKLETERKRYQRGRTTLFQVLQYEQDYVNSQLNTIQTEQELNTLDYQYRLYGGDS